MAAELSPVNTVFGATIKHRVAIYVPSTININEPIDNTPYVKAATEFLAKLCGGATAYNALGSYMLNDETLVTESVTIVWAGCKQLTPDILNRLHSLATYLKKIMTQDSVMVEIDHEIAFV